MSYHIACRGLERLTGAPEKSLFVEGVRHVLEGDVPAARLLEAARRWGAASVTTGMLEPHVRELWALDLNPMALLARRVRSVALAKQAWNFYNAGANLAAPSTFVLESLTVSTPVFDTAREQAPHLPVLREVMRVLAAVVLDTVMSNQAPTHRAQSALLDSVSSLALRLDLEGGLLHEASLCFEDAPKTSVPQLARALGCQRRTLERQFAAEGLTALTLRRACALVGATRDIWGDGRLADVALKHGYTDLAHLSKTFACSVGGLTPTLLRRLGR